MALTLGAAGLTLVVIIGILTGPSVVNCFSADIGMGQCLRDSMTNAGLLPRPALAETAPAASSEPAAIATTPDSSSAPATANTTPSAPPSSDTVVAANFGLLRAEPDGSVVIAGSGTPGSEVQVFANDDLLGSVTVEPSGDWVLVPDAPLPPGGLEITLGETGKTGRAEDTFVVAINEDKSSEPLVVASTPGAASEVLQGVAPPEPAQQLAAADPVAVAPEPAPQSIDTSASNLAAAEAPALDLSPAPAAGTTATAPQPLTAPEPAAPAAVALAQPAATAPAANPAPPAPAAQVPAAAPTARPADVPANGTAAPNPTVAATPTARATPTPQIAPAAPTALASAQPSPAATQPTIDAIEIEGDKTFFGGAGPEDADIRLYVDEAFINDAKVNNGRWLVEAGPVLKNPRQRIRIDVLENGSANVASRAEVNFEVDLPAPAPVAVATAPAPSPAPVQPSGVQERSTVAPAQAAQPAAPTAPTAAAPATPTPAPDPATQAPPAAIPIAPDIPTLVATSVGGPDAARFAAGKAIIRRGDNLWTIARRVYGRGIRYTTIYEANTGQIRDPNQIYPGQVFALPENTED